MPMIHCLKALRDLIAEAHTVEDRSVIFRHFDNYIKVLHNDGVIIDRWSVEPGPWPDGVPTFWEWYNAPFIQSAKPPDETSSAPPPSAAARTL